MEIILFLVFILTVRVHSTDVIPHNEAEKQILKFFANWRNGDTFPITLPSLDVIQIPPLNGSYAGKGIKITYSSQQTQLLGLNNFSVTELSVSLKKLRASGSLTVPALKITAVKYELQGKAFYVYNLKGAGKLEAVLSNITLQFGIQLAHNGNGSKIIEMNLDFAIGDIQANLENSSWPINKLLNKEGVKILNGYRPDIIKGTTLSLMNKFDNYLGHVTPAQLLKKISTNY